MLRDPKVIEHLDLQLTNELTAINHYFLHARTLRHWGVTRLGDHEYRESIEEMRHADWLIGRILFLGGLPNVQRLNPVLVGQIVEEILRADLRLEERAMEGLRDGIARACATTSPTTCSGASWTTRRRTWTSSTASST